MSMDRKKAEAIVQLIDVILSEENLRVGMVSFTSESLHISIFERGDEEEEREPVIYDVEDL